MSATAGMGTTIDRHAQAPEPPVFERPAELVDVSERLYRRIFAVGLWVAVGLCGFAALSALLQPTAGSQLRGFLVCGALTAACVMAARYPGAVYMLLRRQPAWLLAAGAALGAGAWLVGINNFELFLPIIGVIGVPGIATSWRMVLAAGVVAGIGLGAPQFIHGEDNFGGPIAVLVPPLLFWLIVERIAGFALRLHQSLARADDEPADVPPSPEPLDATARPPKDLSLGRALTMPRDIEVDGVKLTARQLQVVLLLCEGQDHAEIARCLEIGVAAVRCHLKKAQQRTGSATAPQLVAWAQRTSLVPRAPAGHQF